MILEQRVAKMLTRKQKTLSIAESCTGGSLTNRLTNIPGSSRFLNLGIVAYSNQAKMKLLGVSKNIILTYGAVSKEVAQAMAKGARKLMGSDFAIGITGIAGPSGATKNKPVGLVYISVATRNKNVCTKFLFHGKRTAIKSLAARKALTLLLKLLS